MKRIMHKSKIHRATVTEANLDYIGSITIDKKLLEEADILPNEKVQVVNNNNGERLETYVIAGPKDSGVVYLNGAAARKAEIGDQIIIISYGFFEEKEAKELNAKVVLVDENNKIVKEEGIK